MLTVIISIKEDAMAMEIDRVETSTSAEAAGDMPKPTWSADQSLPLYKFNFIPADPPTDVLVVTHEIGTFNAHKAVLYKSILFRERFEEYPNTTIVYPNDMDPSSSVALIQFLYTGSIPNHHEGIPDHYTALNYYMTATEHDLPEMRQQARAQLLRPEVGLIGDSLKDTIGTYYGRRQPELNELRRDVVDAHAIRWTWKFGRDVVDKDVLKELMQECPAFREDYIEGMTRGTERLKAMMHEDFAVLEAEEAQRAMNRLTL